MASRTLIASVLALTLAFAVTDGVETDENVFDLVQCDSKPYDQILTEVQIVDQGHYLGEVGIDFTYPAKGSTQNKVVHCIQVKDNMPEGSGGTATIKSGGLYKNSVTISLTSAISKGIDFTITISGWYY